MDYTKVKAEDLELVREPKKNTFSVVHKPSGTVGATPVIPGTTALARYHSPAGLPKEDRKGVSGYVAAVEKTVQAIFKIEVKGANQYLVALAADPAALKITFEGLPVVEKPAKSAAPAVTPAEEADLMSELDNLG